MALTPRAAEAALLAWFAAQGWSPAPFQRQVWRHWQRGESGLLVTPTGSGKTLAALGGALIDGLCEKNGSHASASRLRLLWVTPLRALATDTTQALCAPLQALGLPWTVARRTGDASARDRRLARQGLAEILVITPESLALLLSYPETAGLLQGLRGVIVDEWHELLGNKRGVLLQLTLARVRALAPAAVTWDSRPRWAIWTKRATCCCRNALAHRWCAARGAGACSSRPCCPHPASASPGPGTWACRSWSG